MKSDSGMKIRWAGQLYTDAPVREHLPQIRAAIEENRPVAGLYLITLAENPAEQLDIYASAMFRNAVLHRREATIVALAMGKEAAWQLVAEMARDAYEEYGNCSLRRLFFD